MLPLKSLKSFIAPTPGTSDADIIENLQTKYGLYLETLNHKEKLIFRSALGVYLVYKHYILDIYLIKDAITDALPPLESNLNNMILSTEGISTQVAERLINFLSLQLSDQNQCKLCNHKAINKSHTNNSLPQSGTPH